MGTEKRERKKAGHRARLDAERAAQARAERRRRLMISIAVPATVLVIVGLVILLSKGSGTATDSASSTTAPSTTTPVTTVPLRSAAGKPCVPLVDLPPSSAPTVDIPVGTPPTTLQITDIKEGTGPAVTATDKVTVNYIGVACSSGAIFDESYTAGKPVTFGLNQVIPGWTQGLQGMKAGGVRELVIPPSLGYGASGQGAKIAPDETLIFVVELKSFTAA